MSLLYYLIYRVKRISIIGVTDREIQGRVSYII